MIPLIYEFGFNLFIFKFAFNYFLFFKDKKCNKKELKNCFLLYDCLFFDGCKIDLAITIKH